MGSPPSRREVMASLAAMTILGGMRSRLAHATTAPGERKFMFIYAMGGWDVTRVFAPELLASPHVATEALAEEDVRGNLSFVRHPERPSVDAFFDEMSDELVVINGIFVPTVSHGIARRLMVSGDPSSENADWATRIGAAASAEYLAPHLCISGPSIAGSLGAHLVRSGSSDQLSGLASGGILDNSDLATTSLADADADAVDAFLKGVAQERALGEGRSAIAAGDYLLSLERSAALRRLGEEMDLSIGNPFLEQLTGAVEVLSRGMSRTVSMVYPAANNWMSWDTHSMNDEGQSPLFEGLFEELTAVRRVLEGTPGTHAVNLAEETVVVVLSEMGRTPALNGALGKDHWHYTSAMVWGAGVKGGQVVGGYDELSQGRPIDYETGQVDENGGPIALDTVGASLLSLAGIDPAAQGVTAEVLKSLLESK